MVETTRLGLPLLEAGQANKHVTHNEALTRLDGLIQLAVEERDAISPPGSPGEGDMYALGASPSGDWSGHDGELALWTSGGWRFAVPAEGWVLWDRAEGGLFVHLAGEWAVFCPEWTEIQNVSLVGVNATADSTNKLSVSADAALFSHDPAGSGDVRVKVNKAAGSDTASHLFQSDFDGFAELGLLGDNDFHLKVSPNNFATSYDALVIAADTGKVTAEYGLQVGQNSAVDIGGVDIGSEVHEGMQLLASGSQRMVFQSWDSRANGATVLSYYHGSTEEFRIRGDGDVENLNNNYGAISDGRLKQDVEDAGSQWDDIKAIRLRKYRHKRAVSRDAAAPVQLGVVAQEIAQTSPGLVRDGDENGMQSVKYSVLHLKALGALQEAMARIERLEAELIARPRNPL